MAPADAGAVMVIVPPDRTALYPATVQLPAMPPVHALILVTILLASLLVRVLLPPPDASEKADRICAPLTVMPETLSVLLLAVTSMVAVKTSATVPPSLYGRGDAASWLPIAVDPSTWNPALPFQ